MTAHSHCKTSSAKYTRIVTGCIALVACGRVGFESVTSAGVMDSGPNGLHGACTPPRCPVSVTSPFGAAYLFDGVNDHIVVPFDPVLETTTGLSVTMWLRADRVDPPQGYQTPFSKPYGPDYDNTWELTIWDVDGDGDTDLRWTVETAGAGAVIDRQLPFSQGEWAHVAATWNGVESALFVDGTALGAMPVAALTFDNSALYIGSDRNNNSATSFFAGALGHVCVHDRALTPLEIAAFGDQVR